MPALVFWVLLGTGLFVWNLYHPYPHAHYVGIRFTDDLLGTPLNGAWLCGALTLYCLVRFLVRRTRAQKTQQG